MALLLGSVISFFLLEFSLFLLSKYGNLNIDLPTYNFDNRRLYWEEMDTVVGIWHRPNHSYRHIKECLNVIYNSNSYGSRDKERQTASSTNRVIVLGDSFIEGFGVDEEKRLSNLLENATSIPHLNFGMSGNFGPTQYYLVYKSLASKFSHDAVIIAILPENDFTDDDLEIGKQIYAKRYKPYWHGEYPDYKLVYFQDSIHKSELYNVQPNSLRIALKNFTFSYNAFSYLKYAYLQSFIEKSDVTISSTNLPDFFNFTSEQFDRMKYSIKAIKKIAKEKSVIVITIPDLSDIILFDQLQDPPLLSKKLGVFCKRNNIEYLDLLESMHKQPKEDWHKMYLECDGHWSDFGNEVAAKLVLKSIDYYTQSTGKENVNKVE